MHELSMIAGLFETIEALAKEHGAKQVTAVRLRVGALSGVVPELLESAFEAYKKGTVAEGGKLEIEKVPFKLRCRACGAVSERGDFQFACPACGSVDLELLQGTELTLASLEMETGEAGEDPAS